MGDVALFFADGCKNDNVILSKLYIMWYEYRPSHNFLTVRMISHGVYYSEKQPSCIGMGFVKEHAGSLSHPRRDFAAGV